MVMALQIDKAVLCAVDVAGRCLDTHVCQAREYAPFFTVTQTLHSQHLLRVCAVAWLRMQLNGENQRRGFLRLREIIALFSRQSCTCAAWRLAGGFLLV